MGDARESFYAIKHREAYPHGEVCAKCCGKLEPPASVIEISCLIVNTFPTAMMYVKCADCFIDEIWDSLRLDKKITIVPLTDSTNG